MRHATGEGRTVLHALPVGYALDGVKGIRDPRGMVARQFGVDMNVVTADATVAKNLMLVVERCHLNVEAMAASPYVAGLSVLTDDEADIGAAVVEMGAGTTTIATYSGGRFVHASGFAVGGQHITMDLARGLGACIADAERIKTLYGTVLTGGSDARELMSVPTAGDNERDAPQIVSRATIANIVRHRAEEIFEMVRDRLADSPFAAEPRARVVLSGGASQLTGIRRTGHPDPRPAGAHRPPARLRPAAQRGQERVVRGARRASWSIRNTLILNMSNRGIRGSSGQGLTVISERSDDGFARASDESFPHPFGFHQLPRPPAGANQRARRNREATMALNLTPPDISELKPRITVFGVGGAGGNAVNNMITAGLQGVDFVVANTDAQALTMSKAQRIVQMGTQVTQGLGAGSQPDVGAAAAAGSASTKSATISPAPTWCSSPPAWAAAPAPVLPPSSPRPRATWASSPSAW